LIKRKLALVLSCTVLLNILVLISGCGKGSSVLSPEDVKSYDQLNEITNVKKDDSHSAGYQLDPPEKGDKIAVIKTSMGDICLKLFPENAPKTVQNFIDLANKKKYDGTIFHRVINSFMIQGGDYENFNGSGGKSAKGKTFDDEFCDKLYNLRGSISMANRGKNTNSSQFFINQTRPENTSFDNLERIWQSAKPELEDAISGGTLADFINKRGGYCVDPNLIPEEVKNLYLENGGNPSLDGAFNVVGRGHTVFGQVYEGMDVVDAIANVPKNASNKPLEDVTVTAIEIKTY